MRGFSSNLATPSSGKDKTMSELNRGKMPNFLCYEVPPIDALTSTEGPGFDLEIFESEHVCLYSRTIIRGETPRGLGF